jgi:ribosome-associated toxin RatA of RatAB toxin-antitoxin module
MADSVTEHTTIDATREDCLAVLLDFERYPEWAKGLKEATVLERDAQGRGVEVRFRAAGMGYSTSYTLRYDHSDPDALAWRLTRGDIERKLDGEYRFADAAEGGVAVSYELEVELVVPLPGFIKRRTASMIVHTALPELKTRVEAQTAS